MPVNKFIEKEFIQQSRVQDYWGGGIILSNYEIKAGLLERRE